MTGVWPVSKNNLPPPSLSFQFGKIPKFLHKKVTEKNYITLNSTHFVHDSLLREIFPIYAKNLAFTLLTVGIYRFWARTNVRQFLWGRTRFLDTPLLYLGKAKELLAGFFLVLTFVLIPAVYVWINSEYDPTTETYQGSDTPANFFGNYLIVLVLLIPFLGYVAAYAVRRYRLSRTAWRGISGAQVGSAWIYGLLAMWRWILMLPTLGWHYPWMSVRLAKSRIENSRFGNQSFTFDGTGGDLIYKYMFFIVIGSITTTITEIFTQGFSIKGAEQNDLASFLRDLFPTFIFWLFYLNYRATELRYFAEKTTLLNLRFEYTFSNPEYIGFVLMNVLIYVLTLGTGWAFVQHRQFHFWSEYLKVTGETNFALFCQTSEEGPATGEGIAEMLDIDPGFDIGF